MVQEVVKGSEEASPRSTIIIASGCMTTALPEKMNEGNTASDVPEAEDRLPPSSKMKDGVGSIDNLNPTKDSVVGLSTNEAKGAVDSPPPTPTPQEYPVQLSAYPSNVTGTPQQGPYYHTGYHPHMTPEPPSPGPHTNMYDIGSSLQHQRGAPFHQPTGNTFVNNIGNTPLSPARGPMPTVNMSGMVPPASPLFPRAGSVGLDVTHQQRGPAPSIPYMVPQFGAPNNNNGYQSYPPVGLGSQSSDEGAWGLGENRNSSGSYPSPQVGAAMQPMQYGMPMGRAASGGRAYSFDETMLPPAALDDQSVMSVNPAYSPYGGSQTSPGGAISFVPHPSWGYGGPPDPYGAPGSPLQPRPTSNLNGIYPGMPVIGNGPAGAMRGPMGHYGQYFPASSPGPPIQTTSSNKGPDGANLFIFHIPNHFTNLDMYQLFTPYGNLLSVRIMVEKDTGRSRGFGFVSYDLPDSAALAIKELNGFPIGNKRLKVQHKQIRRQDMQERDSLQDSYSPAADEARQVYSLPPSGPSANQNNWFDGTSSVPAAVTSDEDQQDDEGGGNEANNTEQTIQCGKTEASPLANLNQLHEALPEISGIGTSN